MSEDGGWKTKILTTTVKHSLIQATLAAYQVLLMTFKALHGLRLAHRAVPDYISPITASKSTHSLTRPLSIFLQNVKTNMLPAVYVNHDSAKVRKPKSSFLNKSRANSCNQRPNI